MSDKVDLAIARQKVEQHLLEIEELFKPQCFLTFVMRNPDNEDSFLVITKDSLQEVVETVQTAMLMDHTVEKPE